MLYGHVQLFALHMQLDVFFCKYSSKEGIDVTKKISIKLSTIPDVLKICDINSKSGCQITASNGEYIVDGCSLLGIMSLNLMKPISLTIRGAEKDIRRLEKTYKQWKNDISRI